MRKSLVIGWVRFLFCHLVSRLIHSENLTHSIDTLRIIVSFRRFIISCYCSSYLINVRKVTSFQLRHSTTLAYRFLPFTLKTWLRAGFSSFDFGRILNYLAIDFCVAGMPTSSAEAPVPASAVIAPSSVVHKASPQIHIRHRELDPTQVDTGKDTQKLVEDTSECWEPWNWTIIFFSPKKLARRSSLNEWPLRLRSKHKGKAKQVIYIKWRVIDDPGTMQIGIMEHFERNNWGSRSVLWLR